MVPDMKEKTSAVTIIDPPQSSSPARIRSVRGRRRVNQRPATSPIHAAGRSQEISVPKEEPNIRNNPAAPPKPVFAGPPAPPGRPPPPEPPKIRLSPL